MRKTIGVIFLSMCFCEHGLTFQESREGEDTSRAVSEGILPVPIAYYTPETGFAGGAGVLHFARPENSPAHLRPSATALLLIYTQKKQFISQLSGEWYFQQAAHRLDTDILFMRYPQKFFGVGNRTPENLEESYTSQILRFEIKGLTTVAKSFQAGLTLYFEDRKLSALSPTGLLATGTIHGSTNGITSGVGPLVYYDTRDNIFASTRGSYYQLSIVFHDNTFGSDYQFSKTVINLKEYFGVGQDQVLALQWYGFFIGGPAPFHKLAELGGQNQMRGYYEGRFRDKNYIASQVEFRMPLFWRIGFVAFAGMGDVAQDISRFNLRDIKPSYGFGFRYFFNVQERLNLRLDFGFGNGSNGMYIGPQESF